MKSENLIFNLCGLRIPPRYRVLIQSVMVLLLCSIFTGRALAQRMVVAGSVVDQDGQPFPGVTVQTNEKGLTTVTNENGVFNIRVPEGKTVNELTFSYIGMKTLVVPFKGKSVSVTMREDTKEINEVVVTGMYERKKEGFTGSAHVITGDEIKTMTSVFFSLQGSPVCRSG